MEWKICPKCNFYIATNRQKHFNFCDGSGPRNKKFPPGTGRGRDWAKGKTKENDPEIKKIANSLQLAYATGKFSPTGFCHKDYPKEKLSASGKRGGGYRENAGRSKKFHVEDSFGKIVCLQSTYELQTSEILNKLSIKWIRPKALKYDERKYFADFYLTDFDIWLDPKNDYKAKCDEEKIRKVIEQNNVRLFVLLKEQITEEFIGMLIQR